MILLALRGPTLGPAPLRRQGPVQGRNRLSKGWGLITCFSEDIDLFVNPGRFDPRPGKEKVDKILKALAEDVADHPVLTWLRKEGRTIGGLGRNDVFAYRTRFGELPGSGPAVRLKPGVQSGDSAGLLRVLEVRADEHRLADAAWRLGGKTAARRLRHASCSSASPKAGRGREPFAGLLTDEDAEEPAAESAMDDIYRASVEGRVDGVLGPVCRNTGRDAFPTALRVLAGIATGRFSGYGEEAGEESTRAELTEHAFGIDRTRTDRLVGVGPWLEGSGARPHAPLRASGKPCDQAGACRSAPARASLRLARLAPSARDPSMREGMRGLLAFLPGMSATLEFANLVTRLSDRVPAVAPILDERRIAATSEDPAERSRLCAEIAVLRERHGAEIDAFFAEHPDAERLVTEAARS